MIAMEYNELDDPQMLEEILRSDMWVMEQKMDGTRGLAVIRPGEPMQMLHRTGGTLKHTAAIQHLPRIEEALASVLPEGERTLVLDGEIMLHTGEYRLFDILHWEWETIPIVTENDPFHVRRTMLVTLLPRNDDPIVTVVPQATTEDSKRAMLADARRHGVEGVMVKHRNGKYLPGKRTSQSLKVKFIKTADVVVTSVDRPDPKHGSFELAVVQDGEYLPVGACSAIGKPDAQVGDVIECAYLYWSGNRMYQPRMLRIREDKEASACTTHQFTPYSRDIIG